MYRIFFQTSDFIPPPYANEIDAALSFSDESLLVDFNLKYTQRESMEEADILDEGFTLNDDFCWKGELGLYWKKEFQRIIEKHKPSTTDLPESEEKLYFYIDDQESNPKDKEGTKRFLEQLQQAVFEANGFEQPLHFQLVKIKNDAKSTTILNASFSKRTYSQTINNQYIELNWNQLDEHLKLIFAGDFLYEKASNKPPKVNGLFVSLGDDWWFEVGKSLKINPSKIDGFMV